MPDIPLPEDLSSYIRGLESRIRALETAPKLQNSSVADGTLTVRDAANLTRTQFGLLSDGTYGLGVLDTSGTLVNMNNFVFGIRTQYINTSQNTSSITPADLATAGPSVTVNVGNSGSVILWMSAFIATTVNNQTGQIFLFVDGTQVDYQLGNSASGTPTGVSTASNRIITGLSAGNHTFALKYQSSNGSPVNFSARSIIAQPI